MNDERTKRPEPEDDPRPEYDFSGGVRGKYVERYRRGSNVVLLEPDVAERFPSSEAVNAALRDYLAKLRDDEGAA